MTDCGCLGNSRELRREALARDADRLPAALARWRAADRGGEATILYLLGIGPETCARIERGEVEPEPELADRIWRVLAASEHADFNPHSDASRPRGASVFPAGATAGREGAAATAPHGDRSGVSPELCGLVPRPSFWLARGPSALSGEADAGAFHVEMLLDGCIFELPVAACEGMIADLFPLIAVARQPGLYAKQPRLAPPSTEES